MHSSTSIWSLPLSRAAISVAAACTHAAFIARFSSMVMEPNLPLGILRRLWSATSVERRSRQPISSRCSTRDANKRTMTGVCGFPSLVLYQAFQARDDSRRQDTGRPEILNKMQLRRLQRALFWAFTETLLDVPAA